MNYCGHFYKSNVNLKEKNKVIKMELSGYLESNGGNFKKMFMDLVDNKPDEWFEDLRTKMNLLCAFIREYDEPMREDIDEYKKKMDVEGGLKIYMPKYNVELTPAFLNVETVMNDMRQYDPIELVDKLSEQKTILQTNKTNINDLKYFLKNFMISKCVSSEIVVSEFDQVYEIILPSISVSNSLERLKFVREFKDYLIDLKCDHLANGLKVDYNDVENKPEYEGWKSIVNTREGTEKGDLYKHCVSKPNPYDRNIFIIYNINNISGDNINGNATINNNTTVEKKLTPNDFIEYIKTNILDWYPEEGGWIHIDVIYDAYLQFGLTDIKTHFMRKLKSIWTDKKRDNKTRRSVYLCKKISEL